VIADKIKLSTWTKQLFPPSDCLVAALVLVGYIAFGVGLIFLL